MSVCRHELGVQPPPTPSTIPTLLILLACLFWHISAELSAVQCWFCDAVDESRQLTSSDKSRHFTQSEWYNRPISGASCQPGVGMLNCWSTSQPFTRGITRRRRLPCDDSANHCITSNKQVQGQTALPPG